MEVVVTTGAISRAKLQSNHHHQQTNIQFLSQAGCPSCHPTNSVEALKAKISHFMDLLTSSSPLGVFQLCLWPLIAPGYLGGHAMPLISPLMPVPHIISCLLHVIWHLQMPFSISCAHLPLLYWLDDAYAVHMQVHMLLALCIIAFTKMVAA